MMRAGIIEKLPKTLPEDKVVMVIGHANIPGDSLKRLISDLNQKGEWIRAEFGQNTRDIQITPKMAVVLTMFGINRGTLAKIRNDAKDICCPPQALTTSEVKTVLKTLHDIRNKSEIAQESQNDNSSNSVAKPKEVQHPIVQEEEDVSTSSQPNQNQDSDEIRLALEELSNFANFGSLVENTQLAVMVVADQIKSATAERDTLRGQLAEKDQKIAELEKLLRKSNEIAFECHRLEDENKRLNRELNGLRETLKSLDSLIKKSVPQ